MTEETAGGPFPASIVFEGKDARPESSFHYRVFQGPVDINILTVPQLLARKAPWMDRPDEESVYRITVIYSNGVEETIEGDAVVHHVNSIFWQVCDLACIQRHNYAEYRKGGGEERAAYRRSLWFHRGIIAVLLVACLWLLWATASP